MVKLSRFGSVCLIILAGCSDNSEEWAGAVLVEESVKWVHNPPVPLADSTEVSADLLWSSSGPAGGDYWEAPNWVHVDDAFVYLVDRQASKIHRLSLDGDFRPPLGEPGEGPGQYRRIVDAIPSPAGLFVVDGGNGRVEILSQDGEIVASSPLGQVVFSVVPLGDDAIAVSGMLGRDRKWQRIDAKATFEDLNFPEFIDPDTSGVTPSRAGEWDGLPGRLRFTSPEIQVFSASGDLRRVIDLPFPREDATDGEVEALVSEMASTLAGDGLPSDVIQQQAEMIRSRPRAKFRFRDFRVDPASGLAAVWEQNPEDFGSGLASLHLLSAEGIYLGTLGFSRGWASFDLHSGVLYALFRDPETDLVTLEAFSISVSQAVRERARVLARGMSG